jgi:hypothetical protein
MLIPEYKYADMSHNNTNLSMTDLENRGAGGAILVLATAPCDMYRVPCTYYFG